MLVLTRKANEIIVIDSVIQIQVLKIENGRVKLGFSAPRNVPIRRTELPQLIPASENANLCLGSKKAST